MVPDQQCPRILLAKIGLDGHDRGVKVLARAFRDGGFDVIYTGLWQTAEATMHAAAQEDVDVLGVSLLSAAHLTIMRELVRLRQNLGVEDLPIVLGGIIPESDYPALREMGAAAVFSPGSASLEHMMNVLRDLAAQRQPETAANLITGYGGGEARCLARLLTRVQRDGPLPDWSPPVGNASIIGVTGAPGVGKSSFIGQLAKNLRARNLRVAVVAIDPTSPLTGGSLLGDRLRMMSGAADEGFFVRSVASGNRHDGLGPRCVEALQLLNGFGFDVILLETVGAGQADVAVREVTGKTMLLLMPQAGDAVQFSKAGVMEIADCFVINKSDLAGADATEAQLRSAVGDRRPIWRTCTVRGEGLDPVADWVGAPGNHQV